MRTEQLNYFMKTVELNSINKAAEALYISQSALSIALKKLEKEIGGPLLIKNYQGITSTPLGDLVYDGAEQILQEVSSWLEQAQIEKTAALRNQIKECQISITPETGNIFLFKLISQLQSVHPALTVTIKEGDFAENIADIITNKSQCAITSIWEKCLNAPQFAQIIQENDLYMDVLHTCNMMVMFNKDNKLASKKILSLTELIDKPMILYNTSLDDTWYKEVLSSYGPINVALISNSSNICELYMQQNPDTIMLINELLAKNHTQNHFSQFLTKPLVEQEIFKYIYISTKENLIKYQSFKEIIANAL